MWSHQGTEMYSPSELPRHVEREDREIEIVEPKWVTRPASGDKVDDGEENREAERDPDVARPQRFAFEARICRVDERVDGERDDRDPQPDVEQDAGVAQRR